MSPYFEMLLSFFLISLAVRNTWPKKMRLTSYAVLCVFLLGAALSVTISSYMQYALFSILVAICLFGLIIDRDTRPQNICMGLLGCILALVAENLITGFLLCFPVFSRQEPFFAVCSVLVHVLLFYLVTWFSGRLIRKWLLSGKRLMRLPQAWYLIDAALLLFAILFLFNRMIRGETDSPVSTVFYNGLVAAGYFLVILFLFLSMFRSYQEKVQTEAKQKSFEDLKDYTRNLEAMYHNLRSFKHDYINILTSMSGYIENGDIKELKAFFESKILPTKALSQKGIIN